MTEDDRKFLNAAMQSRLLSMEQALQVKKAIDERPGQKAAGVAVELGLLNIQEVAQLRIEQRRGEGVSPPSSANMTPPAPAVLQKPDSTLRDISRTQGGGSATQAQTPVPKVLQTPEPSAPPPPSSKTASMSARPQSKRSATVTVEEKDRA
jgi:hypothetical protein